MDFIFYYEILIASLFPSSVSNIIASLVLVTFTTAFCLRQIWKSQDAQPRSTPLYVPKKVASIASAGKPTTEDSGFQELEFYKSLFYRLQNVEYYPEAPPLARQTIILLLSQALSEYTKKSDSTILSIDSFDKERLSRFLQDHQKNVTDKYGQYIAQRNQGGPRHLVRDRKDAESWLRKIAPLKLVDGAWLGHLNKITLPFAFRPVMKKTWQVFTEELGDGNVDQHHVYIFENLLKAFESDLPSATSKEILHPRLGFTSIAHWRSGTTQLMISSASEAFFPEILGFNMHFEMLQLDTMQAAKELPEVGLDPYYFILHVSIDNGHSGHAAMSMECVVDYIQKVLELEGEEAAHTAWKRVQAGYILSEWLGSEGTQTTDIPHKVDSMPRDQLESWVGAMFRAKAQAAHGIHAACKAKIGGRSLDDWLSPTSLQDKDWQPKFLHALANAKPWIYPGDIDKSRLLKEVRWGGKMFGTFTRNELVGLQHWINSLGPRRSPLYFDFLGLSEEAHRQANKSSTIPLALSESSDPTDLAEQTGSSLNLSQLSIERKLSASDLDLFLLLPLWFSQCSLLESFVYAPGRTADPMGCAVVRLLRAQLGFEVEHTVVTGIDESHCLDDNGIVGIGLEMMKRASLPIPPDLSTLLARWPSQFAENMLQLSLKPLQNFGVLLGAFAALLELQGVIAEDPSIGLLSPESYVHLQLLFRRQYHYLQECRQHISTDEKLLKDYSHGYALAKAETANCVKDNVQK